MEFIRANNYEAFLEEILNRVQISLAHLLHYSFGLIIIDRK
jgi:hypothetical protein